LLKDVSMPGLMAAEEEADGIVADEANPESCCVKTVGGWKVYYRMSEPEKIFECEPKTVRRMKNKENALKTLFKEVPQGARESVRRRLEFTVAAKARSKAGLKLPWGGSGAAASSSA
jgi:hypothetical protein